MTTTPYTTAKSDKSLKVSIPNIPSLHLNSGALSTTDKPRSTLTRPRYARLLAAMLLAGWAGASYAHGPTPRKTDETVLVNAAPDAVWKLLSEPCAIAKWHPDVAACDSATPAKRTLTLRNGGKISEEVDEQLPDEMSIAYRLGNDSEVQALPVSSLTGRLKVKAEGSGARVSWMARYYRADTTNEPPENLNDEAAQQAVDGYVKNGLDGLAKQFGQ